MTKDGIKFISNIIDAHECVSVSPDGEYIVSDEAVNKLLNLFHKEVANYFTDNMRKGMWNLCVVSHYMLFGGLKDGEENVMGYFIPDILGERLFGMTFEHIEKITNPKKLFAYLKLWMKEHLDVIERIESEESIWPSWDKVVEYEISKLFYEELVRIWNNDKENIAI